MRLLFISLIGMAAAAALALLVQEDSGYVLMGYGNWTLESSLALFLLLGTVLFVALYLTLRLLANLWATPERLRAWSGRRSARRARNALNRGLVELSEGDWRGAEKELLRLADHSETPLLNYLAAARSAQKQGAYERRDHYLQLAHTSMPSADVAVGLTQAELQLAHEQLEQALATLRHLRTIAPKHTYVLKLLKTLYERLEEWEQLRKLLPELRRRRVISGDELQTLEITLYRGLLEQAAQEADATQLSKLWNEIPRNLRANESLVIRYVGHLIELGEDDRAESLLRDALRQQWSEPLVRLYGQVEAGKPGRQLSTAEEWLKKNPRDAALLLTLGRLCLRSRLWGKARSYLEASIGASPSAVTYRELGALLERMEEPQKAMECYRAGLLLSTEEPATEIPVIEGQVLTVEKQPESGARLQESEALDTAESP